MSLRSPYSWLACVRLARLDAAFDLEIVPIYPPPEFADAAAFGPAKLDYMREDVARLAAAYGLSARWPNPFDTDWLVPHAAALHACDRQRGLEFMVAAGALRFGEGKDLGAAPVLADCARRAGLEADECLRASVDPQVRERVAAGLRSARRDKVFGVPLLIYAGERFWGNDRLEWFFRALRRDRGQPLPDLAVDPWQAPHR